MSNSFTTPGSSVHGISQARILEWVAISLSRESTQPRNQTQVSCIAGRLLHFRWILYQLSYGGSPTFSNVSQRAFGGGALKTHSGWNPQRPQFTSSERETETGKVKLRDIVMFASEVDQPRFWGAWSLGWVLNSSATGLESRFRAPGCCGKGSSWRKLRGLDWRLTSEWASSLGLRRGLGLLGEWGLESSFASDASRFHHTLGPEAIRLFSPNVRMLSPFPFFPVARSWLPVSSPKSRGSTVIFVEKGFPEKPGRAAVANGTESSSGCWGLNVGSRSRSGSPPPRRGCRKAVKPVASGLCIPRFCSSHCYLPVKISENLLKSAKSLFPHL